MVSSPKHGAAKRPLSPSRSSPRLAPRSGGSLRCVKPSVGYFCMEYGVDQALTLYSGGLGILAGDIVKTVKDEDLPVYAVGIFWDEGYTHQVVSEGHPKDTFRKGDRSQLVSVHADITVTIQDKLIRLNAYRLKRLPRVYLLEPVEQADRNLYSSRLYQGGDDIRVAQEIILGVGGVRLFRAIGLHIDIYHFNEGHAVFAGLEMIREKMVLGMGFEEAWQRTRDAVVFTTHTPIPAGNEQHDHERLIKMSANCSLTKDQLTAIGGSPFGMTVAGLRLSNLSNAVSQLHGETARKMWMGVTQCAPILAITNGVHNGSWQDKEFHTLVSEGGSDDACWTRHEQLKHTLVEEVERRTKTKLDTSKLLVGFARRSATYKRHTLVFHDLTVLGPLLASGRVQFIFSGKAHPADESGKKQIEELLKYQEKYPQGIVYLENYDMDIGKLLTSGCDVWMNNPVRPQEASGTSGMKAAMNGVLNLSIPDGWWPEGCEHGVNGWQVGPAEDGEQNDAKDARALAKVLLEEVVPRYYSERPKWIEMMKKSITMATKQFSASRMMQEYYDQMYLQPPQPRDTAPRSPTSKRQRKSVQ